MFEQMLRLIVVVSLAAASGKLAAKLKMPAVLGFLIAGMAFGPHAAGLLTQDMLDSTVYRTLISYLECGMGFTLKRRFLRNRLGGISRFYQARGLPRRSQDNRCPISPVIARIGSGIPFWRYYRK